MANTWSWKCRGSVALNIQTDAHAIGKELKNSNPDLSRALHSASMTEDRQSVHFELPKDQKNIQELWSWLATKEDPQDANLNKPPYRPSK